MKAKVSKWFYPLCALVVAGCAGAKVTEETQRAPLAAAKPAQIVVYPFAISSAEVTLNQSIGSRIYRNMSDENSTAEQAKLAHDTAQNVCVTVSTTLTQKGYNAVCLSRGVPVNANNALVVDGEFTNINEGNRLRRMVIGLGAGASTLDTSVEVSQVFSGESKMVMQFTTHADSGKMPGAAITGPPGAVAGGAAAAASLGANVAAGGVKSVTSSTGYLADKTSTQIINQLTAYFQQQGWQS
ncbi:MAG TPA: DUF4410 domain-containing protein [Candidatus Binataceae bacterium]|nr:DUF4410 domain-containing protein [Candidatus Binataceae bacterium]